jgi:hypothetical protein
MAKNINSAYRVREILKLVSSQNDKLKVNEVWSSIFGLEEKNPAKVNSTLSRLLADLHDEVESTREDMFALEYSNELFSPSLDKCNQIFSPHLLMATWQSVKQQLNPEVINTLGFCSEILPNEEDLVDIKQLEELKDLALKLRESLANSTLPKHVLRTVKKHLVKIEDALILYKISGIKEFGEALQAACGEVVTNEELHDPQIIKTEEVSLLKKTWSKSKEIMDGVVSAEKRISAVNKVAEKSQGLIEYIGSSF